MLQLTLVVSSSLAFSFRFRTPLAVEFDWSVVQFNPTSESTFFSSKNRAFTMPQIALFSAALSVLNNALTSEVRIEESWLAVNLGFSGAACCCGYSRGAAAAEESPTDRNSDRGLHVLLFGPGRS